MTHETVRPYTEAEARHEATRCLGCSDPTCMQGCPAGVNVQEFIREIATGNLTRAARLLMQKNPFYWSCAYICPVDRQCEGECRYSEINYAVTVARLQQYVAQRDQEEGIFTPEFPPAKGARAAVVGGGAAGLTCAWQLALNGIEVTVFERRAEVGGMVGWAIPSFRLPDEVRTRELARFGNPLIQIRTGESPGPAVSLLENGFDAVFVATGLQASARAGLPGEESAQFALELLDKANRGELDCRGEHVLVIGGGSVAMDVCGTVLQAGARKAEILCLEAPNEMPACRGEIDQAWDAGVIFHTRLMPKEIVVDQGQVKGVRAVAIEWQEPDRFVPSNARELPGTERLLPGTVVVEAIGQRPTEDQDALLAGIERIRGLVRVDDSTMMTSVDGIFAGGDIVNGGGTVAGAVDHGNRAAEQIADRLTP